MKTARQLSLAKRVARQLKKDPEHFAKIAARGKGKSAPGRARPVNKELSAKGGRNRNNSMQKQQRRQRSIELAGKIEQDMKQRSHKEKVMARQSEDRKSLKHRNITKLIGEWDENETTTVDEWS